MFFTSSESDDAEIASYLHNKESDNETQTHNFTDKNYVVCTNMNLDYNRHGKISTGAADLKHYRVENIIPSHKNPTQQVK